MRFCLGFPVGGSGGDYDPIMVGEARVSEVLRDDGYARQPIAIWGQR